MTEDEHIAAPEVERRPLVQWLPTGRTKARAELLGAFAGGLMLGVLVAAVLTVGRERLFVR